MTADRDGETSQPLIEERVEDKGEGETVLRRADGTLTPEGARQVRLAAVEQHRARQAAEQAVVDSGRAATIVVPIPIGTIVTALVERSKKGDPAAARELRSWLELYPAEDDSDVSKLDRRTRQSLYAKLLDEIRADQAAAVSSLDRSNEADREASSS